MRGNFPPKVSFLPGHQRKFSLGSAASVSVSFVSNEMTELGGEKKTLVAVIGHQQPLYTAD